jgi:hypothetical protein
MISWCQQVNGGNCGIPWVNCAVLCVKDDQKGQFWGLRYCLSKLRSLLTTVQCSKIAQFNWACRGRLTYIFVKMRFNIKPKDDTYQWPSSPMIFVSLLWINLNLTGHMTKRLRVCMFTGKVMTTTRDTTHTVFPSLWLWQYACLLVLTSSTWVIVTGCACKGLQWLSDTSNSLLSSVRYIHIKFPLHIQPCTPL